MSEARYLGTESKRERAEGGDRDASYWLVDLLAARNNTQANLIA